MPLVAISPRNYTSPIFVPYHPLIMGFFIPIQHSVALAKAMGWDTGDWRYSPLETTPNRIEWEWEWEVSASLQILFRGDLPGGGHVSWEISHGIGRGQPLYQAATRSVQQFHHSTSTWPTNQRPTTSVKPCTASVYVLCVPVSVVHFPPGHSPPGRIPQTISLP